MIKCGDVRDPQPLGDCDDRGVSGTQRKVCVLVDEVSHPVEVGSDEIYRREVARAQAAKKQRFDCSSSLARKEIAHFGDNRTWHQQRPGREMQSSQQFHTSVVVVVVR